MEKNNALISEKNILYFYLAGAVFALAGAYISEIFFGLHPCKLCYYQRIPYFLIAAISLPLLFLIHKKFIKSGKLISVFLYLIALIFIFNSGLAAYHTGVEYGIFKGPDTCSAAVSGAENAEDMLRAIISQQLVSCKDVAFSFLGISMAGWNAIYAMFFAISGIYLNLKNQKK